MLFYNLLAAQENAGNLEDEKTIVKLEKFVKPKNVMS